MFYKRFTGHDFLQVVSISDEASCNILGYNNIKYFRTNFKTENFKLFSWQQLLLDTTQT